MTVEQSYEIYDDAFRFAVEGSAEGWRTTLDKLEREVARAVGRRARRLLARTRVQGDAGAGLQGVRRRKRQEPLVRRRRRGPEVVEREMDVRPGGRELAVGKWKSGMTTRFDAVYFDVVPDRRLVYAYEMHLDARKISVSLACVEIEPHPAGVKLKVASRRCSSTATRTTAPASTAPTC